MHGKHPQVYRERTSKSRMDEWQNMTLHGQFLRQAKDLSSHDTWKWLQRGELKKEKEGMISAVQDQALRARYIQRAIEGTNISPKCRKCKTRGRWMCLGGSSVVSRFLSLFSGSCREQLRWFHTSWNKTVRTIFRVEKASTQFRGSLQVNDHTPEIF